MQMLVFFNYYYCPAVTSFIIFTAVSGYLKKSLLPFLWYLTGITVQSSFTFIHLADAFIQSCAFKLSSYTFDQFMNSLGIKPMMISWYCSCHTLLF